MAERYHLRVGRGTLGSVEPWPRVAAARTPWRHCRSRPRTPEAYGPPGETDVTDRGKTQGAYTQGEGKGV